MDRFRDRAVRELGTKILGVLLLGLFLVAMAWIYMVRNSQQGSATGQIVSLGGYANSVGDRPLLVLVPDGSTHEMVIPRNQAIHCRVGGRISIVPVGRTYVAGSQGCDIEQDPKP